MKKLSLNDKITPKKYYLILIGTYLFQVAIAALLVVLCFFVLPLSVASAAASGSYLIHYIFIFDVAGLLAVVFTMTYRYAIAKIDASGIFDLVLFFLLNVVAVFTMTLTFGAGYQTDMDNHSNFISPLEEPLNWLFLFFVASTAICILAFLTARFRPFFDKTWKYLGASPVIVLCVILAFQWLLPHNDLITNIFCIGIAIIFSLIGGYELFQATTCEKTIYNALDKSISLFLDTAVVMAGLGTTKNDD